MGPARCGVGICTAPSATKLRADAHTVQRASTRQHATTLLAGQPLDVLLLATLEQPTDALELLRELCAGRLPATPAKTCPS